MTPAGWAAAYPDEKEGGKSAEPKDEKKKEVTAKSADDGGLPGELGNAKKAEGNSTASASPKATNGTAPSEPILDAVTPAVADPNSKQPIMDATK